MGRNSPVLMQCLQSVAFQKYARFDVVVMDDASDRQEQVFDAAKRVLGRKLRSTVTCGERSGAVALYKKALPSIDPERFIVNVDADDYLTSSSALSVIAECVRGGAWFVFGRHRNLRGISHTPEDWRGHIVRQLTQRTLQPHIDHPRCTYAGLLAAIPDQRLKYDGRYPLTCVDLFLFGQAMELAGSQRSVCTNQIIYEYRSPTTHNVAFTNRKLASETHNYFVSQPILSALPEKVW